MQRIILVYSLLYRQYKYIYVVIFGRVIVGCVNNPLILALFKFFWDQDCRFKGKYLWGIMHIIILNIQKYELYLWEFSYRQIVFESIDVWDCPV